MQKLIRYFLATIICAFVFGATIQINAQDQQNIRALYERMSANQKSLTSLKARVRMETYNPQIKDTEGKDGTVIYLPAKGRNANVRIDWEKPEQETLSVVNGEYKLYRPRLETVYIGKTKEVSKQQDGVGSSLSFINMSSQELKQNFSAEWRDPELIANGSISAYHLKLTPKTPQRYQFVEIWVTEDGMPVQVKVHEKNGDTTNVLLYEIQKNVKINKSDVAVNLPKNVKVIKG
jgi:outer membrane lipoprotein-sorting protein